MVTPACIVVEASPLISVLKIDRFDLLEVFESKLVCVNHVREEIAYFHQDAKLAALLDAKRIFEVELGSLDDIKSYDALRTGRPSLGPGECASVIYAQSNGSLLVITDKSARGEAKKRGVQCMTTEEVVVLNIQKGLLTVAEADALIVAWRAVREGVTKAKSFGDLLP